MLRFGSSFLIVLLVACGGDDSGPSATPPAAPTENDPAFTIEQVRDYYLIGNDATPGQDELIIQVIAPDGVETVDVWLDGGPGIRLADAVDGFAQALDIAELEVGEHELLLAADGADTAFARVTFQRTHPLYVLVTTDWDDPDNNEESLSLQEELHEEHPELRLTHFVGPYTFTDPVIAPERVTRMVEWVTGMRDTYDDEIGLHIHPYCSFVEAAGLTCITSPSYRYTDQDSTGYSVFLGAYDEAQFTTLVAKADELFQENGLGKPTTFRAGGWTAELSTLRALDANGYVADTSAVYAAPLEEEATRLLFEWAIDYWSEIGPTSQPYYPSETDIQSPGDPSIPVLEVPDNGNLVDYVTAEEMIEIFDENYPGGALEQPVTYTIGYHPPNFDTPGRGYKERIHEALLHAEQYLASRGDGPVVYATLHEIPLVWKR